MSKSRFMRIESRKHMESLYLTLYANPFSDADVLDYQSDNDNEISN